MANENNNIKIDNYFELANEAFNNNDYKTIELYCNKILEEAPRDYLNLYFVWFMKGYAVGFQSTVINLRVEEAIGCFSKAIDSAPENKVESLKKSASQAIHSFGVILVADVCDSYAKDPSPTNAEIIMNLTKIVHYWSLSLLKKCGVEAKEYTAKIAESIFSAAIDGYNNIIYRKYCSYEHPTENQWTKYKDWSGHLLDLLRFAIDLDDNDDEADVERWNAIISIASQLQKSVSYEYTNGSYLKYYFDDETQEFLIDMIMEAHTELNKINPSHVIPQRPKPIKSIAIGGCYVATCIYGSYDCPQVWTLRRFRDDILGKTLYGRLFIKAYYAVSPTLVKCFGKTSWFKNMWKPTLDKMVSKLQAKGIENTPYEDKMWR